MYGLCLQSVLPACCLELERTAAEDSGTVRFGHYSRAFDFVIWHRFGLVESASRARRM
jgi:hypothetical protein